VIRKGLLPNTWLGRLLGRKPPMVGKRCSEALIVSVAG
jgi:hypothetical protein